MKPIMFFDGGCSLCRREVAHYRSLDRENSVSWVDISRETNVLPKYGIGQDEAMKRLHVLDDRGRIVTGVAAFVTIWRQLPFYRHLAWLIVSARMIPLLDWAYVRFAGWRFRRRCGRDVCPSSTSPATEKNLSLVTVVRPPRAKIH